MATSPVALVDAKDLANKKDLRAGTPDSGTSSGQRTPTDRGNIMEQYEHYRETSVAALVKADAIITDMAQTIEVETEENAALRYQLGLSLHSERQQVQTNISLRSKVAETEADLAASKEVNTFLDDELGVAKSEIEELKAKNAALEAQNASISSIFSTRSIATALAGLTAGSLATYAAVILLL